ncbi:hypothetical protein PSJE_20750 [Pseudomonas jessenii]|nr:hypothetical protein PSJE_20750 [Pseudomonas jessenii]
MDLAAIDVGVDLWRGGLPPLGCEAAPKPLMFQDIVSATHSNGGKPPRHKPAPTGNSDTVVTALKLTQFDDD